MDIIKNIAIIFLSIFFESLPFLLLGSFISSIIERYVSNDTIVKIIPKNVVFGSIVGVILGFFLPACDCAVIPISKRLIKKKVPINVSIAFMLSSPIINPVVLLSTYYAFYKSNFSIFVFRIILGILIALIVGIIMGIIFKNGVVKNKAIDLEDEEDCCCHDEKKGVFNDIVFIMKHTIYDSLDVVKYLMFGAIIASLVQVIVPHNIILFFGNNNILSVIILMLFAYLISLCSTSDSFVGKSLLSSFGNQAILAYLLLGPMIDIKNTIVLLGNFKKKFVLTLISCIFIFVFILSILVVR